MSGKFRANACASAFAMAIALHSAPAFAQEAVDATAAPTVEAAEPAVDAAEPAVDANAGDDTEIVVTAQKRSENVQDVPISIAAFSGDTLEKNNVVNIEGLSKITPNLSVAKGAQTSYVRLADPRHWRGQQHDRRAQRRRLPRWRLCPARRRGDQLDARHGKRRSAARPAGHAVRP